MPVLIPYISKMKLTITLLVLCCVALCWGQSSRSSRRSKMGQSEGLSQPGLPASLFSSDLMDSPYAMALMMSRMMGGRSSQNLYSNLPIMMLLGGNGLDILPTDNLLHLLLVQSLFQPAPQMPMTDLSFLLPSLSMGSTMGGMEKAASSSATSSP